MRFACPNLRGALWREQVVKNKLLAQRSMTVDLRGAFHQTCDDCFSEIRQTLSSQSKQGPFTELVNRHCDGGGLWAYRGAALKVPTERVAALPAVVCRSWGRASLLGASAEVDSS